MTITSDIRRETSRALATALAHYNAGNARAAEAAATDLVDQLRALGILGSSRV